MMSAGRAVALQLLCLSHCVECRVCPSTSVVPRLRGGFTVAAPALAGAHHPPVLTASAAHGAAVRKRARARAVVEVGALFSMCTGLSLLSDTLTKKLLQRDRSLTATVTFFHFAMSALGGIVIVALPALVRALVRPHEAVESAPGALPPMRAADLPSVLPLALVQALGFLLTNLSLRYVPVSFSHTVKACECLFTALLTFVVLRQSVSLPKYASLLPVAGGVALSSATEVHFSTAGFLAAMTSNLCFASRSVLSTRLFRRAAARHTLPEGCCGALALLSPLFARQIDVGALLGGGAPLGLLALCGLAHFSYNLLSFMILQRTNPIAHVILHAVRRMLVIGISSAMLRNRIRTLNWAGIVLAFLGVLGYTLSP